MGGDCASTNRYVGLKQKKEVIKKISLPTKTIIGETENREYILHFRALSTIRDVRIFHPFWGF